MRPFVVKKLSHKSRRGPAVSRVLAVASDARQLNVIAISRRCGRGFNKELLQIWILVDFDDKLALG